MIRTIRKWFESFECKLEPFEQNLKRSNANSNMVLKHSNPNSNHSKGHSNANSKLSNGLLSFQLQILTIRKGCEAIESKFKQIERDSKYLNANSNNSNANSNHSNANSNHSTGHSYANSKLYKGLWSFRMQILTIRKEFEPFKCKF